MCSTCGGQKYSLHIIGDENMGSVGKIGNYDDSVELWEDYGLVSATKSTWRGY